MMHWFAVLFLLLARAAAAVIIASGDGTGNAEPPPDDPGWAHVGRRAALSVVYIGHGWVLSARHVAFGDVEFAGVLHPAVEGSRVTLGGDGPGPYPDLAMWRLDPPPALAPLPIRRSTPPLGTELILIGRGKDRGEPIRGTEPDALPVGWAWAETNALRWGTNRVAQLAHDLHTGPFVTRAFATVFMPGENGSPHEAQAAMGDSGGPVFARADGAWELAGVMFTIGSRVPFQPPRSAVYGNTTYVVDLSHYRDEILAIAIDARAPAAR